MHLTCSFLLLCPRDLSTALQLLSSWTACLSWAFSSALTLRTWARASASVTHWVSCRSLCSRSSSKPASTPWWGKKTDSWGQRIKPPSTQHEILSRITGLTIMMKKKQLFWVLVVIFIFFTTCWPPPDLPQIAHLYHCQLFFNLQFTALQSST